MPLKIASSTVYGLIAEQAFVHKKRISQLIDQIRKEVENQRAQHPNAACIVIKPEPQADTPIVFKVIIPETTSAAPLF